MNKRVKRMWVKALRSGEYKQAQNSLLEDGRYCCLGVLCELAKQDGVRITKKPVPTSISGEFSFNNQRTYLPPVVVKWSGITDKYGSVPGDKTYTTLADRNDSGWSFKRIATLIEKKF